MIKSLLILCCVATLAGCYNSSDATRALEGAGYTNITLYGYTLFGCGKDDVFHTSFSATGPTGKPVSGVVCSGFLKGSTIRTN